MVVCFHLSTASVRGGGGGERVLCAKRFVNLKNKTSAATLINVVFFFFFFKRGNRSVRRA